MRIFISHTSEFASQPKGAKRSYLQAAKDAITRAGHVPAVMQEFAAEDKTTAQASIEAVEACEMYIRLIGFRFGSPLPDRPETSYTQLEYETAGQLGKKRLLFMLADDARGTRALFTDREHGAKQDDLRESFNDGQQIYGTFNSPATLETVIYQALREQPSEVQQTILAPKTCRPPTLPPGFVDRPKKYGELLKLLLETGGEQPVSITTTLHGAGGFGKTTLAMALCEDHDIKEHFDDILWVTLGQDSSELLARLSDLITHITHQPPGVDNINQASAILGETLGDSRVLLVIDDVWRRKDLMPFLQGGLNCTRLVTTRFLDVAEASQGQAVELDEMETNEAAEMLAWRLNPSHAEKNHLQTLADTLGEWPLLLNLANGYLWKRIQRDTSLETALNDFETRWAQLGPVGFDRKNADNRNDAVAVSMQASLEMLDEADRIAYLELGIFPEDTDIPVYTLSQLWNVSSTTAIDRLMVLDEASLLRYNSASETVHLHDVIWDYLTRQLDDAPAIHNRLLQAWGNLAQLPDSYAWQWVDYHLLKANREAECQSLLLNPKWMIGRLKATGIISLLQAYYPFEENETLHLLQQALKLASGALTRNPSELCTQLATRLSLIKSNHLESLVSLLREHRPVPGLFFRSPSLHPPGAELLRLEGHNSMVRSIAIDPQEKLAVSASNDRTIKVWDLENGQLIKTLRGHADWVRSVAIDPEGNRVVSASKDGTLKVWDLENGQLIKTFKGHSRVVRSVAIDPRGKRVVSASNDLTIKVWDLENGQLIKTLRGHADWVRSVAIDPEGNRVVSASKDGTLKVWDLESGKLIRTLTGHSDWVNSVAIDPKGRRAVSASSDGSLKVWDLKSGKLINTLIGHSRVVRAVAIGPNGKRVVSASFDKTLKVWNLESGKLIKTLRGHSDWVNDVAVYQGGKRAVSASKDKTLKVWHLEGVQFINVPKGHTQIVRSVATDPKGKLAVSASHDDTLKIWDLKSGQILNTLKGHKSSILCVAIDSSGKRAVSASYDKTLKVWNLEKGTLIGTLRGHSDWVNSVAIDSQRKRAVSVSSDRLLKIWNLKNGKHIKTLRGHYGIVRAVAIDPLGSHIVSASRKGTIKVWDLRNGKHIYTLKGHFWGVNSLAIDPFGNHMISASSDRSLKIWDLKSGRLINTLKGHTGSVMSVAINAEGNRAISASTDRTLKIWDLEKMTSPFSVTGDVEFMSCAFGKDGQVVAGDTLGRVHFLDWEE